MSYDPNEHIPLYLKDLPHVLAVLKLNYVEEKYWYLLGSRLGLSRTMLDEIKATHDTPSDCLTEMLTWWLSNFPSTSWDDLANALNEMGHDVGPESLVNDKEPNEATVVKFTSVVSKIERALQAKPYLDDLLYLLSPYKSSCNQIGAAIDAPMDPNSLSSYSDHEQILQYVLKWWLDKGDSLLVNSPVTWDNIISIIRKILPGLALLMIRFVQNEVIPSLDEDDYDGPVFGKVDQKYLRIALEKGESIESSITKAILQGPARAGKTSLRCLLLSKIYTDENSTGCIEDPHIAEGQFAVGKFASSDDSGKWIAISYDELAEKVCAELHSRAQKLKLNEVQYQFVPGPVQTFVEVPLDSSFVPSVSVPTPSNSAPRFLSPSVLILSDHASSNAEDDDEDIKLVQELLKRARKGIEAYKLSIHQQWLYFIDSGGQIQFQKLLQAFLPSASVLMLVFSLADDFSSPSSTVMRCEDLESSTSDESISVEEVLRQLITMANSTAQEQIDMIKDDEVLSEVITPPNELSVIAVGTHRDVYDEKIRNAERVEDIDDKNEKLETILRSLKRKVIDQDDIIHEVDGRKAKAGIFDDEVIKKIAKELQNKAYKVRVPLKWYCLDILLHKIAQGSIGVLTLSRCKALGIHLGMPPEEVVSALKFFHILNTMLFYSDSPDVKDLVFVQPQVNLVAVINDLMKQICTFRTKKRVPAHVKELVLEGKITIKSLMEDSETCSNLSRAFDKFEYKLLGLFEHLLIATKISCDDDINQSYFMPALLPVIDPLKKGPPFSPGSSPLLYYFANGSPMGFFCAVIVNLLTNHSFNIVTSKKKEEYNYSNFLTLSSNNMEGRFVFIEKLLWFEVHCECPENNNAVRMAVEDAITAALKVRKLPQKIRPECAFICHCDESLSPHPAVISLQSVSLVKCVESNKTAKDERCVQWCNYNCEAIDTKCRPELCDLMNLLASIAPKYFIIGTGLNVPMDTLGLDPHPQHHVHNLSTTLKWWLDNGNNPLYNSSVTWYNIINVIKGPLVCKYEVARQMEEFLAKKTTGVNSGPQTSN